MGSLSDEVRTEVLCGHICHLEAENAKLRELCKEGYRYTRKLIDEFLGEPEADEDFMTLEDRLRELGVEPY